MSLGGLARLKGVATSELSLVHAAPDDSRGLRVELAKIIDCVQIGRDQPRPPV